MEQLCRRKTRRLAEKIFYNERYKEGTTIRWVGGAEMSTQDLYPRWETHKQKDNYNLKRLSPGSEGVWVPHWAPQHRSPISGRQDPECLTSKARGAYFQERQRAVKKIPLLKDTHKISPALGPRTEAVIWKEPRSEPPADWREPPREARSNWSSAQSVKSF